MSRQGLAPEPAADRVSPPSGVALVTGGSRGIGAATCRALAAAGWDVAIVYRQHEAAAREVASQVAALGRRASMHRADVGVPQEVRAMVEAVERSLGPIDLLVNNAGVVFRRSALAQTLDEWQATLAVNLTGPFLCIQAVLPGMIARSRGSIVNVASIAGLTGGMMGPAYAAAKGGLVNLTRNLARELAPHGIRVNCVAPTLTDTDLLDDLALGDFQERLVASFPMQRLIRPDEVAAVIVFLASDAASYVSGECIKVTGGG